MAKLLIQLHLVAFGCFPYRLRGAGMRGSRLRGNDEGIRGNDACRQCRGWRGDGAMGICRWIGVEAIWLPATNTPPLLQQMATPSSRKAQLWYMLLLMGETQ